MTGFRTALLVDEAAQRLGAAGAASPRLDAELLLAHAMGTDRAALARRPDGAVTREAERRFRQLVARRVRREPVAFILGRQEFWSLTFAVTCDTLIPRPDSETLVEAALGALGPRTGEAISILDLGTGTGCLLLALLAECPRARGLGIDIEPRALAVARRNARALGLAERAAFLHNDWMNSPGGADCRAGGSADLSDFDVIVANPPYVATAEFATLPPEIAIFEPRRALEGGADGLAAYRRLAPQIRCHLVPSGFAAIEIGAGQAAPVKEILTASGLEVTEEARDLGGHPRCLIAGLRTP